jgi:hypothetical protein
MPLENSAIPTMIAEDTFVTYAADGTLRFWNLDGLSNSLSPTAVDSSNSIHASGLKRNIYSKECLKIMYVDSDGTLHTNGKGLHRSESGLC